MRSPFSLYVKNLKSGPIWYARFTHENGDYAGSVSTGIPVTGKKGRKQEAIKIAEELAEKIVAPKTPYFLDYLESFWKHDSPYVKSKRLVDKKPLSAMYLENNAAGIRLHVKPYEKFKNLRISEVKAGVIEDWKIWAIEKGVGTRRINAMLQAMSVPKRYAYDRGDIDANPFNRVKRVSYTESEKGVLSRSEVAKLLETKDKDPRATVAIKLAVLTGIRRGEVRGMRWKDIDEDEGIIHIVNNYVNSEGDKECKRGSNRDVLLPSAIKEDLAYLRENSPHPFPDDYVMFNLDNRKVPCSVEVPRLGFVRMLEAIGITKEQQKERNLTFHGMRHTFVTLARMAGLPDITVQALAGHKSAEMMNRYSHANQVIDFNEARKKLERHENKIAK